MAKFKTGDDPADHTPREVVDYLKSDEVTGDEYDRVIQAEREGKARTGIMNLSGDDSPAAATPDGGGELETPAGEPAAGPNEAATGQESPADEAKTVDDPHASGDAGTTAEQYPDEAPAALGPDMPQSQAEADAHLATLAAQEAAAASDVSRPATQTPEEARTLATKLSQQWKTPRNTDEQ